MKKFILFQLVLLLSLRALADGTISFETRQVPVNRGGEDGGTVTLRFYEDMPSVPYISVADFQQLMLPGTTITVSKTGEGEYLLEGPLAKATVNITSDQFSSDDYMNFTNLMGQVQEGMDNVGGASAPFLRYNHQELTPASATVSFDFSKYGIDLRGDDTAVYFPFATISDIFCDTDFHVASYNGEKVVVLTGDSNNNVAVLEPENAKRFLETENRNEDMAAFCYAELCFVIDHFYGMPGRSPLESGIQSEGLDKTLDTAENGPLIKQLIKSTNMSDYFIGMKSLQVLLADGGHTSLMVDLGIYMATQADGDNSAALEKWKETNEIIKDKYPSLYQPLMEQVEAIENNDEAYFEFARPTTSDEYYYKEGDTAYLMYNSFGDINEDAWKEYYEGGCVGETPAIDEGYLGDLSVVLDALKRANEDPEVKNFVVDLSTNTGGDFDLLMAMSVLMGGPNYYYSENIVTGQRQKIYYDVDCNFDGVFDENDKDVKYDLNIAVLISKISFSCANLLPSLMKDTGFPVIGERSGGGACAVQPFITPEGMQFQISSARARLTNDKWENIDTGIEPNYVVDTTDGYDAFYDVSAISDIINNHYNTDSTGILYVINRDDNHEYYDLFGRKLAGPPAKGIYIVDGKKVVK